MKTIIHKSADRGIQNHGWLQAAHSFSFASYHDPAKVHFGLLRVLNDDIVAPGMGFGTHAHDNMEIITIPLKGSLAHKDSLGSEGTINPGEVQIMSAGSGIRHSEFNASATEEVNLLQIWVFPKKRNIQPRYDQKDFTTEAKLNDFQLLVSPDGKDGALAINQDAWFSLADFEQESEITYEVKQPGNGVYAFLIEGSALIAGEELEKRDALGVIGAGTVKINVSAGSKLLLIDLPME